MPLFHSNAVMAGWAPALYNGASVALREKFSASEFLPDVRRFGATYASYVGKPLTYVLATPGSPTTPTTRCGSSSATRPATATSGVRRALRLPGDRRVRLDRGRGHRQQDRRHAAGALGWPAEGVAVHDPETGQECPRAELDASGRVINLDECVGELVNTTGAGQFAGYYNDDEATAERMRGGMYWSGDLAYRDDDGWVWFAGRTAAWLRVDGENLATAPIEQILLRHPAIDQVAVYAVPDERAGDQVAAALVLRGELAPDDLEQFLDEQRDLSPKARPRYVRVLDDLPRTATNKVLHRELSAEGIADVTWTREERGTRYADRRARQRHHGSVGSTNPHVMTSTSTSSAAQARGLQSRHGGGLRHSRRPDADRHDRRPDRSRHGARVNPLARDHQLRRRRSCPWIGAAAAFRVRQPEHRVGELTLRFLLVARDPGQPRPEVEEAADERHAQPEDAPRPGRRSGRTRTGCARRRTSRGRSRSGQRAAAPHRQ